MMMSSRKQFSLVLFWLYERRAVWLCEGGVRATGKWSREYPSLLKPQPCLERTLCVFPDWHSLWRGHNNMTREGRGSGLFVWHPPLRSPRLWHCMNLLNFSLRGFSPYMPPSNLQKFRLQPSSGMRRAERKECLRGKERGGELEKRGGFWTPEALAC